MWDTSSSQSRYSLHSTGTFGGWVVGMSLLGRSFKRTFREIWREEEEEGRREVSAMAPAKPGKARKGVATAGVEHGRGTDIGGGGGGGGKEGSPEGSGGRARPNETRRNT